jgi:hypothetical protein
MLKDLNPMKSDVLKCPQNGKGRGAGCNSGQEVQANFQSQTSHWMVLTQQPVFTFVPYNH